MSELHFKKPLFLIKMVLPKKLENGEQGSVLVMIIISILIIASVGAAMLTTSSTSMFTQIGSVDTLNGYFLAEAGKHYALPQINWELENDSSPTLNASQSCAIFNNGGGCTSPSARTFTLPNSAGQFSLSLQVAPVGCNNSATPCTYNLTSTGIPNSGTNRVLTFEISE